VARRSAPRSRKPTRRVKSEFKPSSPWPNIEGFLEAGGNIEIGRLSPIGYVAVASDEHTMLAALTRNADETLMELIQRLEAAVDLAINHDTFTDEINGP
jgi:hypothetical protein